MLTIELIRAALGWCIVINTVILLLWFFLFILAHDFIYRFHQKWFKLGAEQFDGIHYAGMALYKIGIWLFVIVPYLALHIVG